MKILVIEDDERIAYPLIEDLKNQNHVIDLAMDGLQGWNYAITTIYDLILLDVMLPGLDGISLCQRLRQQKISTPILILTARDTTTDKVIGLDAGADDYLIKPFELEELAARIRALSRRGKETQQLQLSHGKLFLDPNTCQVRYEEKLIYLTPKEYMILELFLRNPNKILTRSNILDKLWSFDQSSGEGTVKTHITNLRNKLKSAGCSESVIETVYGIGYRLESPNQ
ncbi:response regulator transcription factor [Synechocystis sp. LKSZ1]|uniref:response regulator transcription factor n=1 Tax=Synechocystis sp. LKSZ1 TaxID=3144951 RepID=UPI00336C00E4